MHYTSIAIELKWACRITDSLSIINKIKEYLDSSNNTSDRFLDGGIPQKSIKTIFNRIAITQNWLKRKNQISIPRTV
jgi:hypothetical protein